MHSLHVELAYLGLRYSCFLLYASLVQHVLCGVHVHHPWKLFFFACCRNDQTNSERNSWTNCWKLDFGDRGVCCRDLNHVSRTPPGPGVVAVSLGGTFFDDWYCCYGCTYDTWQLNWNVVALPEVACVSW